MKKAFSTYPFFIVLLPLFIVLHIEKQYTNLIPYKHIYKDILSLFIIAIIIFILAYLLFKSLTKASIFSLAIFFPFYYLGEIKNWLRQMLPGSFLQSYTFIIPISLAFLIYIFIKIRKTKNSFASTFLFANSLLVVIILIDILSITAKRQYNYKSSIEIKNTTNLNVIDKPDIYYIIFDSYTSTEALRNEFNYDNTSIENFLKEKGFYTIPHSTSNYNLTPFSVSSIFKMDYLYDIDTIQDYFLSHYLPGVQKVYDNPLFPFFEKEGYQIFNHSIFNIRNHPSSVPSFDIWKTSSLYTQHNIIKKAYNEIGWNFPAWVHNLFPSNPSYEYIKKRDTHDSITISHLFTTIQNKSNIPKFVYGHIFIPHAPYSFDSLGNQIYNFHSLPPEKDRADYVQQLVFTNKVLKKIVNEILLNGKKNSVIIIQGDHGYRTFDKNKKRLEFFNFNAMYLPSKNYDLLNDSLSSVNTFRVILNSVFQTNFPLLPNKTFFLQYR